jgi:hypothetical protein
MANDDNLSSAPSRATVALEHTAERVGDVLWHQFRRRPYLGVVVTGVAAFTLAATLGVGELAVAGLAAYGMFKILRRNEPPSQAFKECARIEKELGL